MACEKIAAEDLRAGDYAKCTVPLKDPRRSRLFTLGNQSIIERTVRVVSVHGPYLQVEVRNRKGLVAIRRDSVLKAWRPSS